MRRLSLFVFLVLFTPLISQACESSLIISFSGDWQPYFYSYGNNEYAGADYDLLQEVADKLGCALAVLPMTEARSHIELRKGSYDVLLGASFTRVRAQDYLFSAVYREEQVGVVLASNNTYDKHTRLQDVLDAGGIVGINMSGYFGELVEHLKAQYPSQFVHGFSLGERIRLLAEDAVDAIVDDRLALCTRLTNLPSLTQPEGDKTQADRLLLTREILHKDNIHFMFSKHTTELAFVHQFNAELAQHLEDNAVAETCPSQK